MQVLSPRRQRNQSKGDHVMLSRAGHISPSSLDKLPKRLQSEVICHDADGKQDKSTGTLASPTTKLAKTAAATQIEPPSLRHEKNCPVERRRPSLLDSIEEEPQGKE